MWKQLPYKKKIYALAALAFLLLLACYRFSFSKTVDEYRLYRQNMANASSFGLNNNNLNTLRQKEKHINTVLGQFLLDTLDNSKNLLAVAGNYCNNNRLRLKEYKPYPVTQQNSMNILSRHITVEGRFVDMLKLIYALENNYKTGKVSGVYYKSFSEPKTNATILNCTIYIQNVIPTAYEKK